MGRVSSRDLKTRWTEYCVKHKLNTTQQREAIVELFLRSHDHVSIDDILARVRKKHPKVGYATVYRTLKLLEECGVALSRHFDDGQTRYEVAGAHHDHLICVKCNMILEFENDEIERLQDEMAAKLGGFRVLRHKHELYCICPKEQGVPGGNCPHDKVAAAGARN
ncbi:MAG TPA: transcriptional repressor [Haliangiales bacterium]|nr:transcriptional repressor [Haliangiales bacterium]